MPVKYRLYLFVDNPEEELNRVYESKINLHNEMILNNEHADSGFDLFVHCSNTYHHTLDQ